MAERYPDRTILVVADICRALLMCTVAIHGLPAPALIALLFATSCFNPPFQAARSALLPRVLEGDRLTLALTVNFTTMQAAQAAGYLLGGALAAHHARTAILANAASFALSALLIRLGIRARPAGVAVHERTGLLRETADGFRLVFSSRTLRGIVIVALAAIAFPVVPEGMAAGWAAAFSDDPARRGPIQGMIMLASPIGAMLCGILFNRLVNPVSRRRLAPIFAILTPLCLVPRALLPTRTGGGAYRRADHVLVHRLMADGERHVRAGAAQRVSGQGQRRRPGWLAANPGRERARRRPDLRARRDPGSRRHLGPGRRRGTGDRMCVVAEPGHLRPGGPCSRGGKRLGIWGAWAGGGGHKRPAGDPVQPSGQR